jgi:hypothetical protein
MSVSPCPEENVKLFFDTARKIRYDGDKVVI